jgi:hypothetical protein
VTNDVHTYFDSSDKAIVYNLLTMDSGWRLEAYVPRRVSSSDRVKVLEWLGSYSSEVKRRHPQWLTRFREADQVYFLDIHPVQSTKDVKVMTQYLQGEMWQQLSFDYGR